jgi:hypothetical protein
MGGFGDVADCFPNWYAWPTNRRCAYRCWQSHSHWSGQVLKSVEKLLRIGCGDQHASAFSYVFTVHPCCFVVGQAGPWREHVCL